MAILGVYGEDTSFSMGATPQVSTSASLIRSGFSRCAVYGLAGTYLKSKAIDGGAVTSCWFTCRMGQDNVNSYGTSKLLAGLVLSSTANKGLWIASSVASQNKLALTTFDGTTKTELAVEGGSSLPSTVGAQHKIDVQLVNYGASATVHVYCDGSLVITFSGDVTVSGVTNVDCVGVQATAAFGLLGLSEMMVADQDTRALNLQTLAPTGVGTTDDWTAGTLANLNATTINDSAPYYTNVSAKDEEFNITDLVVGTWNIVALKREVRACKSSGSPTPTKLKLGYNNAGAVTVGSAQSLTTAYATYEQLDLAPYVQADMNGLQSDFQSST